jgi:hypothetical protein
VVHEENDETEFSNPIKKEKTSKAGPTDLTGGLVSI